MEIKRVLRRGGQLTMIERVRSKNPVLGRIMDALNLIAVRLGDETINRDTIGKLDVIVEDKLGF